MRRYLNLRSFLNYLSRNKLYTFITVFGFSVSLMFVLVLGLYVYDEFTVDRKRDRVEDIYLLQDNVFSIYSYKFADQLTASIPDITQIARMMTDDFIVIDPEKREEMKVLGCIADEALFDVLSLEVLEGDAKHPIPDRSSVSITPKLAQKLFGTESPIGKSLQLNGFSVKLPLTVTSVFKDVENSGFRDFDMLINLDYYGDIFSTPDYKDSHNYLNYDIVLLTSPNADVHAIEQLIPVVSPDFVENLNQWRQHMRIDDDPAVGLRPIADDYFAPKPKDFASQSRKQNSKQEVYILFSVSLMLLIFSLINYINLSVAQSRFRLKEFAMRKLLGGTRVEVFAGLLFETLIVCLCSFAIALLLASLAIPVFNVIMESTISLRTLLEWHVVLFTLGLLLLVALISGLFPAFQIFRVNPITAVKGIQAYASTKFIFGRLLLFVQFFITSLLLTGTIIMFFQLRLIQQGDLGFNRDGVLHIPVKTNKEAVYDAISRVKGVKRCGKARGIPVFQGPHNGTKINNSDQSYFVRYMLWDKAVFEIFNLNVSETFDAAPTDGVWFDQYTWSQLPINPSDRTIKLYDQNHPIKGIVRDFRFNNVMAEKELLYLRELQNEIGRASCRERVYVLV